MHDIATRDGKEWFYSETVKEHFFSPKNIVKTQKEAEELSEQADGIGIEGSPACGDMMKMWIRVKNNRVIDCRWQTFGCASAIAATSMFSTMVTENDGMEIGKALKIKPQDIVKRLEGLPLRKIHCSVLADKTFKAAIKDYNQRL